ncbi:MAG: hypothetical protein HZA54_09070 [Planctomycetes bacterium]|nr:hypothetical protein [Planctomycetota bacterium]
MIRIRKIKSVDEFHACEDVQKAVWNFEDREIIPVNELITIQRIGGAVLGAFEPADKDRPERLVGFCFGMPGRLDGRTFFSSRMLAVLPAQRGQDLGFKLKLAQRDFALAEGYDSVTWTFDPLQSINAYFNIEKLGARAHHYLVNLYGHSTSVLNRGLDTDRFLAHWEVGSTRVTQRVKGKTETPPLDTLFSGSGVSAPQDVTLVNETYLDDLGILVSGPSKLKFKSRYLLVEIPPSIQVIQTACPQVAQQWRYKTREIFQNAFKKRYQVIGFVTGNAPTRGGTVKAEVNRRRSFYLLEKAGK